jgi:catechol 2,3-dioxygenase-like lactoylglutathione lyase family enzyme
MSRFHVHLNVTDLEASVQFYSALFGAEPSVLKNDYAKWMLEDPRVNFAVSTTGRAAGIDHLGIQADSADELASLGRRLETAGRAVLPEVGTTCCYARSDKAWTTRKARAGKHSGRSVMRPLTTTVTWPARTTAQRVLRQRT